MNPYHKIDSIFKRDSKGKFYSHYSCPEFEYLANNKWRGTEKLDGTNIRVMWDNGLAFGGRSDAAQIPAPLVNRLNKLFTSDKLAKYFFEPVCLYGEGIGPKIQKGSKYGEVDFVLFDVRVGDWWLKDDALWQISDQLEIKLAPTKFLGNLKEAVEMVKMGIPS